ncbi:glycoside hydrolase family 127 protein [Pedobacter sp. HMF7647]|uniref:Glycoside hydrolase family 127 protein n=1 Tax=Hufsiella arboris TaxID=2695275 RepID=A0A7K1YCZ3_9SPHI|nr:glycoside hydrolase family 127 protein [Hufsiella arboris]MXV52241.1 glycoside hydrolase family 127 protein [Hufsiella arboris]
MKKVLICFAIAGICLGKVSAQDGYIVKSKVEQKAVPFKLENVRLLPSPFKHAMELDAKWLLSLDPDRFLNRFMTNAGLQPKGEIYGGWEARGVSGHSLGHYLSACSMMYAASGDKRFKEKVDYIVNELAICQDARKTGYVGGIPDEDKIFDQVAAGDIRSQGFDLNGGWVPWYTEHKVLAGLIDAYTYTGNEKAKQVAVRFCDWIDTKFKNLTEAQFQKMLDCEHGGMNEALANIYAITGDKKYLALSYRFHHKKILDPLSRQEDQLAGVHANTQIPKIIGCARRYELTGDAKDHVISQYFWNEVTGHHSYVIGGNSDHEHFGEPDKLNDRLSDNTTETCNTYNMLKLTEHLYELDPKSSYMDYYERALYNHILASQNPDDGMVLYYMPLASGSEKPFGTPDNSFWCCTGTGMENHAKYGESIYYKAADGGLYVNLFIPSVLNWQEKGIKLQLDSKYPDDQTVNITFSEVKSAMQMPLAIRYPKWAVNGAKLLINGKPQEVKSNPGSYITLNRSWKKGDKVQLTFPMSLYTESMPDNKDKKAFLYGPLVLAGELGNGELKSRDIPMFVSANENLAQWVKKDPAKPNVFETMSTNTGKLTLAPLYKVYGQKQAVYWDFFTPEEWTKKKAQFEAERKADEELAARTIDVMRIGEMQPERDHNLTGDKTETGSMGSSKWRDARDGGWFSFTLDTKGNANANLQCTYWGSDSGNRQFAILIEGKEIAREKLDAKHPNQLYNEVYEIPTELLAGKKTVTVKFQAMEGSTAGGVFGCRLLKK